MHIGAPAVASKIGVTKTRCELHQRCAAGIGTARQQGGAAIGLGLPQLVGNMDWLAVADRMVAAQIDGKLGQLLKLAVEQAFGLGHTGAVALHGGHKHHQYQGGKGGYHQEDAD